MLVGHDEEEVRWFHWARLRGKENKPKAKSLTAKYAKTAMETGARAEKLGRLGLWRFFHSAAQTWRLPGLLDPPSVAMFFGKYCELVRDLRVFVDDV
jgi:hypothetical protein